MPKSWPFSTDLSHHLNLTEIESEDRRICRNPPGRTRISWCSERCRKSAGHWRAGDRSRSSAHRVRGVSGAPPPGGEKRASRDHGSFTGIAIRHAIRTPGFCRTRISTRCFPGSLTTATNSALVIAEQERMPALGFRSWRAPQQPSRATDTIRSGSPPVRLDRTRQRWRRRARIVVGQASQSIRLIVGHRLGGCFPLSASHNWGCPSATRKVA